MEKYGQDYVPNCPECVAREKKKIEQKYADDANVNLTELFDEIEVPMKLDPSTKHFICKRCGLYATREQLGDIKDRLNRRQKTREDKQYEYLEWWQKSKKEKRQI